jgi:hypothetical protein
VDIIIHISHTSIFALLFDLCSKLYNPYGPRECFDIPHKAVGVGIRKLARQLCRVELPATMDASSVNGGNLFMEESGEVDGSICLKDGFSAGGGTLFKSIKLYSDKTF